MPELEVFVHMLPLAAGVFQQELPVKPTNGREDVQQEHNARALLTLMGSEWAKVPKEKLPVHPHCTIRDVRMAAIGDLFPVELLERLNRQKNLAFFLPPKKPS